MSSEKRTRPTATGDYKKDASVAKSVLGNEYQMKIQCLAIVRALKLKLDFKLITELKLEDKLIKAQQFNDCIFSFNKGEETVVYCVEAKHRQGESKKICARNILGLAGSPDSKLNQGFQLQRYFDSFVKLREDENVKNAKNKYFILYTPLDLEFEENESESHTHIKQMSSVRDKGKDIILCFQNVQEEDPIFNSCTEDTNGLYKLIYNPDIELKNAQHEDIKDFLECFRFYVNQRIEQDFDSLLTKEITQPCNKDIAEEMIHSLQNNLREWIKDRKGCFYTSQRATNTLNKVKGSHSRKHLMELSRNLIQKIDFYKLETSHAFEDLDPFLEHQEWAVLNITSHNPLATSVKVQQALKQPTHKLKEEYCLLHISSLQAEKHTEVLLSALSSIEPYLLLIVCDEEQLEKDKITLVENLYKFLSVQKKAFAIAVNCEVSNESELTNTFYKKLVLISNQNHIDSLKSTRHEISAALYKEKDDEEHIHFQYLTKDCQEKILEKQVNFQGIPLLMKEIVDEDCFHLLNEDVLVSLCERTEMTLGKPVEHIENTTPCFVNRTLLRNNIVRMECLEDNTEDIFAVSGDYVLLNEFVPQMTNKKVYKFSDIEHCIRNLEENGQKLFILDQNPTDQFRKLCANYAEQHIHWLHAEKDYLFWQKSYISCQGIRKYIDTNRFLEYQPSNATWTSGDVQENQETQDYGILNISSDVRSKGFPRMNLLEKNHNSLDISVTIPPHSRGVLQLETETVVPQNAYGRTIPRTSNLSSVRNPLTPNATVIRDLSFTSYPPQPLQLPSSEIQLTLYPSYTVYQGNSLESRDRFHSQTQTPKYIPNIFYYPLSDYNFKLPNIRIGNNSKAFKPQKVTDIIGIPPIDTSILAAEAGMGKTTLLKSMATQLLKSHDPKMWVLFLTANDVHTLSKVQECDNFEKAIELLSEIQGLCDNFTKELSKYFCFYKKVVVLMDGFDEISEESKKIACALVKQLLTQDSITLLITTKLHLQKKLEDLLCTSAYTIKYLDEKQQQEYLKNIWLNKFGINRGAKKKIDEYAKYLIDNFSTMQDESLLGLLKIPYHVELLAEMCADECRSFCGQIRSKLLSTKSNINIFELYKSFVDKRYSLFVEVKSEMQKSNPHFQTFMAIWNEEANMKFASKAVLMLFPTEESLIDISKHFSPGTHFDDKSLYEIGLIQKKDETDEFIHDSFAEYFVATLLSKALMKGTEEQKNHVLNFLNKNITKRSFDVIRLFLDHQLCKEFPFYDAIHNIEEKFESVADDIIGQSDCLQRTVLHLAAYHRANEVLGILAKKFPTYIDQEDKMERTAIQYAVERKNWTGALLLADEGAEILLVLNEGDILLLFENACTFGKRHVVSHMLNFQNLSLTRELVSSRGLLLAARNGHKDVIEEIIKHARKFLTQKFRNTALAFRYNVLGYVEKVFNMFGSDFKGRTSIHLAAESGHKDIIETIVTCIVKDLKIGIFPFLSAADSDGNTPFHLATRSSKLKVVKYLLKVMKENYSGDERGTSICQKNKENVSPLFYAVKNRKNQDIAKLYIDDILNTAKSRTEVPLTENPYVIHAYLGAVMYQNVKVLKYILEILSKNHADVCILMLQYHRVLHMPAANGCFSIISVVLSYLKSHGENTTVFITKPLNNTGKTLLHCCAETNQVDTLKVLLEYLKKRGDSFSVIAQTDQSGHTPVSYAAFYGHSCILRELLTFVKESASSPLLTKGIQCTLFHKIASTGDQSIFKLLCECVGKQKNSKDFLTQTDRFGRTPVSIAAGEGNEVLVEYMLEFISIRGGNASTVLLQNDKYMRTCLHWAVISRNEKLVKMIVQFIKEHCANRLNVILQSDVQMIRPTDFLMSIGYHRLSKFLLDSVKESSHGK